MDQGGDGNINGGQRDGLTKQSASVIDECRQDRDIEKPSFGVEQIRYQAAQEKRGVLHGNVGFAGRVFLALPTLPGQPKQIDDAAPTQRLVKPARIDNDGSKTERCREADNEQSERTTPSTAANPARRPLSTLITAR
jgi:hypothetical protein